MLVKKKNPEWYPSENKGLKVGETVEITDPRDLIIKGDAVAVGETGEEVSAYELYGVITRDERQEFEEYLKIKSQQALKSQLEKEQKELEKLAETAQKKEEPVVEVKPTVETKKVEDEKKKVSNKK